MSVDAYVARGESGHAAPVAVGVLVADATDIDIVLRVVGQSGEGMAGSRGGCHETAAMAEAVVAVLYLEADVAFARCPAEVHIVDIDVGGDIGRGVAGDGALLRGSGGADPVLTGPVVAAEGFDIEVVGEAIGQAGDDVAVGVAGDLCALALSEAGGAVLDGPALCHGVGIPVERNAVGGDIADGETGHIGTYGGGELDGVAPVAFEQVGATKSADGCIVGESSGESAEGDGTGVDAVGAVVRAVPYVDVPEVLVAVDRPDKVGSGIGDGGDAEAVGREAGAFIGEEGPEDPLAIAKAVDTTVETHAERIAGGG